MIRKRNRRLWGVVLSLMVLCLGTLLVHTGGLRAAALVVGQPAGPAGSEMTIPFAATLPVIDGDVSEWSGLSPIWLHKDNASHISGDVPIYADLSAQLRGAWTPSMLYFAAVISDEVLVGNNSVQIWGDDSIELSIHVPVDRTHQFTIVVDGRQGDQGSLIDTLMVATRTIPGGWSLEVGIPVSAMGLESLYSGQQHPFTFALWDDDLHTFPGQTHMFWQGTSTTIYSSDWGVLDLQGSSQFPTPSRTPTATRTMTPVATHIPAGTPTPTRTSTSTPLAWTVQRVDSSRSLQPSDRSLQIDSNGQPHIAYGGESLHYGRYDGAVWHLEVVDDAGRVGPDCALALDSLDQPHISYHDVSNGDLKYARWTGANWHIETVDSADNTGFGTSLVVDSRGTVQISYHDSSGTLKYAIGSSGVWKIQIVDTLADGGGSSLALDRSGNPHISYFGRDGDQSCLKYAVWTGSAWSTQSAAWVGIGVDSSLAIAGSGKPLISFYDLYGTGDSWDNNFRLMYATNTGEGWAIGLISRTQHASAGSLAADAVGNVSLSYYDSEVGGVKFVRLFGEGGPANSIVEARVGPGGVSLAFDRDGPPHVAYYDSSNGQLKHAHWRADNWEIQVIDEGRSLGSVSAIAVDQDGEPRIVYASSSNEGLRLASRINGSWKIQSSGYAPGPTIGLRSLSMALDRIGSPHLCYLTETYNERWAIPVSYLYYVHWSETGWMADLVEEKWPGWDRGCSLALGLDGNPNLSYWDADDSNLGYIHRSDNSWNKQTVDASGDVGYYSSLVIGADGHPHISYWDAANKDLKYARHADEGWRVQAVDHNADVGRYSALALDGLSQPHIVYSDETSNRLKYAAWADNAWSIEVVPGSEQVSGHASLALDASWDPHLVFRLASDQYARYAVRKDNVWQVNVMTSAGKIESDPVLALDPAGTPHVSFLDAIKGDLMYVTLQKVVADGSGSVFLPLILHRWPPVPDVPVLDPIAAPGANTSYTVRWNAAYQATSYVLEQATDAGFSDAAQVYAGTATSKVIPSQGIATYHYRVKAHNSYGDSGWSNAQAVEVRWEREPNNAYTEATGPVASGVPYYGYPSDEKDYSTLFMPARGTIVVELTGHVSASAEKKPQLLLYDRVPQQGNEVQRIYEPPYRLEYVGEPGQYYVYVYTPPESLSSAAPYTLRATFP